MAEKVNDTALRMMSDIVEGEIEHLKTYLAGMRAEIDRQDRNQNMDNRMRTCNGYKYRHT
jgi:hypothetical protein